MKITNVYNHRTILSWSAEDVDAIFEENIKDNKPLTDEEMKEILDTVDDSDAISCLVTETIEMAIQNILDQRKNKQ